MPAPHVCGKAGHGGFLRGGAPRLSPLRGTRRCLRTSAQPDPPPPPGAVPGPRKWRPSLAFPFLGTGWARARGKRRCWGRSPGSDAGARRSPPEPGERPGCAVGGALRPRLRGGLRGVTLRARRLARGGRPRASLLPFKVRRGGIGADPRRRPRQRAAAAAGSGGGGGRGPGTRGQRHEWVPGTRGEAHPKAAGREVWKLICWPWGSICHYCRGMEAWRLKLPSLGFPQARSSTDFAVQVFTESKDTTAMQPRFFSAF